MLIFLAIILLILFVILLSPFDMVVDSDKRKAYVRWLYFITVALAFQNGNINFVIDAGPYRKVIDPFEDKKKKEEKPKTKEEKKRKKKKKKARKIKKLLKYAFRVARDVVKSIKMKKLLVVVDTGNPMLNGLLVAPFSQINASSGGKSKFFVNWAGNNRFFIWFRFRLIKIIIVAIKHLTVFFK